MPRRPDSMASVSASVDMIFCGFRDMKIEFLGVVILVGTTAGRKWWSSDRCSIWCRRGE